MFSKLRFAILLLALFAVAGLAACSMEQRGADSGFGPNPEEMRAALTALLHEHPDLAMPEFVASLEVDEAVVRGGTVHIGAWKCDPKLMTFEGLFSAPNITLFEVSGRFDLDARGIWVAIPRRVQLVHNEEVGEYWRPQDVEPR